MNLARAVFFVVLSAIPWNSFCADVASKDLLKANLQTTDYTAVVLIRKSSVTGPDGGRPAAKGYVRHVYEAQVSETLKGPPLEFITYSVMAEADLPPRKAGLSLLVSLCRSEAGTFHVPDNGYEFEASEAVKKAARAAAKEPERNRTGANVCHDE